MRPRWRRGPAGQPAPCHSAQSSCQAQSSRVLQELQSSLRPGDINERALAWLSAPENLCAGPVCSGLCGPARDAAGPARRGGHGANARCGAQVSRTLSERISAYAGVVLETVAYAGTGDVLKVQRLLALCGEHTEVDEASAWKVPTLPPTPSPPHTASWARHGPLVLSWQACGAHPAS